MFVKNATSGRVCSARAASRSLPPVCRNNGAPFTCAACHSESGELPLSGGPDLSGHSPLPVGVIVPPNLTPGGPIADWSDEEIAQIIRNGLNRDGRTTLMPTESLRHLSDADIAALIAYLRSQPPVQHETPPTMPSPLLAVFFGAGLVGADVRRPVLGAGDLEGSDLVVAVVEQFVVLLGGRGQLVERLVDGRVVLPRPAFDRGQVAVERGLDRLGGGAYLGSGGLRSIRHSADAIRTGPQPAQ